MRRLAAIAVLIPSVACVGLFAGVAPGGPVKVVNVSTDTCGGWQATALVPAHVIDWELEVWVDESNRTVVDVPARTEEVLIGGFAGQGSFLVHVASAFSMSDPVPVEIGPIQAGLRVPSDDTVWPRGEVPDLDVEIVAGCSITEGFTVSAEAARGEPVAIRQPVEDGRVFLPTSQLGEGRHVLNVTLFAGDEQVSSTRAPLVVGPPCVDEDNDGHEACKGDCDDSNPDVHPGVEEVNGDGLDNDCDGANGLDRDRDGVESAEAGGLDCNDSDPRIWGGQLSPPDADGDGFYAWDSLDYNCDGEVDYNTGPHDCDDEDPRVPAPDELPDPNNIDDDCDGIVDEGTIAYDDDGDGQNEIDGDCNDADATVFTGGREIPDCKDNDCDGEIEDPSTLPHTDDRYEKADDAATVLPGAMKKKRFLGIDTGYRPTSATLGLTSHGVDDAERFQVWTHDGNVDTWHVTATIPSMGDRVSYRVEIAGEYGSTSGTISTSGGYVQLLGKGGVDNSGDYTVTVTPAEEGAEWCPFTLVVSSG